VQLLGVLEKRNMPRKLAKISAAESARCGENNQTWRKEKRTKMWRNGSSSSEWTKAIMNGGV